MTAAPAPSTPERPLFRAFEQLADAPGGMPKLRELILQLALQGQLVEQRKAEQNDKTWHVFLDEFDARVYTCDPGPPPPFEIPESWRWACLAEVAAPCGQKKPDELRNERAGESRRHGRVTAAKSDRYFPPVGTGAAAPLVSGGTGAGSVIGQ